MDGEEPLPGMVVDIKDLDDVLIRDVGNKVAGDGRWPLVVDPSGQASVFLRYLVSTHGTHGLQRIHACLRIYACAHPRLRACVASLAHACMEWGRVCVLGGGVAGAGKLHLALRCYVPACCAALRCAAPGLRCAPPPPQSTALLRGLRLTL